MSPKIGEIYDIRNSKLKYRFCCDYIRIARISLKTFTIEACYRRENLIYKKDRLSKFRIYKSLFYEELELKSIKLV